MHEEKPNAENEHNSNEISNRTPEPSAPKSAQQSDKSLKLDQINLTPLAKFFAEQQAQRDRMQDALRQTVDNVVKMWQPHASFAESAKRLLESSGKSMFDLEITKLRKEIANKEAALAQQTNDLARKSEELQRAIEKKTSTEKQHKELEERIRELTSAYDALKKEQDLGFLLDRVCSEAGTKLLSDPNFKKRFEEAKTCSAFVLAIDIRRSTDLMLRGKTPQQYAEFLNLVCGQLVAAIKKQFGIVDKFTGDGLLAYFPDFFAGKDAGYRAVAAAQACHVIFEQLYRDSRTSFTVTLKDVGLGIGIDFGEVHLLRVTGELTVVGAPVVYACRLSGAPAGHTYLNHSAVAELEVRCKQIFKTTEVEFDIKHEGLVLCQDVILSAIRYDPMLPDWLSSGQADSVVASTNTAKVERN